MRHYDSQGRLEKENIYLLGKINYLPSVFACEWKGYREYVYSDSGYQVVETRRPDSVRIYNQTTQRFNQDGKLLFREMVVYYYDKDSQSQTYQLNHTTQEIARYEYDPWGNPLIEVQESIGPQKATKWKKHWEYTYY